MDSLPSSLIPVLIIGVALVVLFFLTLALFKAMWKVAEPNEALIISGRRAKTGKRGDEAGADESLTFRIVTGGGAFSIPGLQTVRSLKLNLVSTGLEVECVTKQGIPVKIKGSVIFKIGDTFAEIANAARRFLDQQNIMVDQVHAIFSGHLRAIVGNMTVEELISDRESLRDNVREASGTEMAALGLKIDSMQLLEIGDPTGYIKNLSAPHTAEAEAKARIAQAQQNQAASEAEATASVAVAEAQTAAAKRRSQLQAEADTASEEARQAGPLAEAKARQAVVEAATATAKLEADRREQELLTEVRRPADARAYETKVTAEAERDAAVAAAEAAAKTTQLQAAAEAEAARVRGAGEADAVKARGLAEAEAAKARGLAEADAMSARADALTKGKDALIAQQVAENLPAIVAALTAPYGQISNLTVLNGAEGMSQMVVGGLGQLREVLPALLGALNVTTSSSQPSTSPNGTVPLVSADAS